LGQVAFLAVAAALLLWSLAGQWDEVAEEVENIDAASLAVATLLALIASLVTAESWRVLLADLGSPVGRADGGRIFFIGQLGKYVPGSIWPVVVQMEMAAGHGVTRRRTVAASLVSLGVILTTGLVVAAVFIPLGAGTSVGWAWLPLVLLPLLFVVLHPAIANRLIGYLMRLIRRPPLEEAVSGRGIILSAAWAFLAWAGYGVHTSVLADGLGQDGADVYVLCVGAFALAWAIGFVVPFAPAGGGARELALVALLSTQMPASTATLVALLSRLILTGLDLVLAGVAAVAHRRGRRAHVSLGAEGRDPAGGPGRSGTTAMRPV
jgi:uncharacterized membrane protein YbhN (UPF0104 family)